VAWEDLFRFGGEAYALQGVDEGVVAESDTGRGSILFAQQVTTGETAMVTYAGLHRIPAIGDEDAQITVPKAHWEALQAFVEFRAHWELESDEASAEIDDTLWLSQLGENARRAWNRVREVMDRLADTMSQSAMVIWDPVGRVY
jgi:hypothetical protein